jgi:class 3 adenylate cyclase
VSNPSSETDTDVDLQDLLDGIDNNVKTELSCQPEVIDKGDSLDVTNLPIAARKWHKVKDAVAVVSDLKSSTQLGLNKHAASTASIYEAATGCVVKIFDDFDADFVAIQGDGAFALFWGTNRMARAVCAGITIKTFSAESLVPRLENKWPDIPETGLKVGIANSPLLVKRVGVPRTDHQEPVWPGRAVNYAAKAAQQADRHQMTVTGAVWDWASKNDYLAVSCTCKTPSPDIWVDSTIDKIPEDDADREGKLLLSQWCEIHGAEYCSAVLEGKKRRSDVTAIANKGNKAEMQKAIRNKARREREARTARLQGMTATK